MKRNFLNGIIAIITAMLIAGLAVGCGNSKASESEAPDFSDEEDMAASWEEEDEDFDEDEEDEDEDEEDEWDDEEDDEEEEDFFDSHGLELSEPGDFSFTTAINDGNKDTGEIDVDATVEYLGESIEDDDISDFPEGYKVVKAVFSYDISNSKGASGILADGVFDRYTGTSFEFDIDNDNLPYYDQTEEYDDLDDGYIRLETPDGDYDITMKQKLVVEYPNMTKTFWIICPNDYNGTVFYAGYEDLELSQKHDDMDLSEGLYTMDELPWFDNGRDYYYFSMDRLASVKPDSEDDDEDWDEERDEGNGGDEDEYEFKKRYTEEEVLELAKTLSGAPNAEIDGVDPDGTYNIHLYGKNSQDTWDWYYIDPLTLVGTNILGEKVDLKGAIQQ